MQVVARCLEKDPAARFAGMREVRAALVLLAGAAYLGARSGLLRLASHARGDAPAPGAIRSIAVLPLDNYIDCG